MQSNISKPCLSSGVCTGLNYEFGDASYINLVSKLSIQVFSAIRVDTREAEDPVEMLTTIKEIDETALWTSIWYKTSATLVQHTKYLACIPLYSKWIASVVIHTTAAHGSDQHDKETEKIVFLISDGRQSSIGKCEKELCGSIVSQSKRVCMNASKTSISYSTTLGKIYYNMRARDSWDDQIVEDALPQSKPSYCIWVEEELKYNEACQAYLENLAGVSVKSLSLIDFLISPMDTLPTYIISKCITFIPLVSQKFCKKVIRIHNQLCNLSLMIVV